MRTSNLALIVCGALMVLVAPGELIARGVFVAYTPTYDTGSYFSSSIAIADVNRDGKLDAIVASACGTIFSCNFASDYGGPVVVLLGNGDGTFQAPIVVGESRGTIAVADVNGDGKPDLIEISIFGTVDVQLGNGNATFQPALIFDTGGSNPQAVTTADVNRDGNLDLLIANGCPSDGCGENGVVGVLLGNGDGTFQAANTYGAGGPDTHAIAVGDMNRDGNPDLLVSNDYGPAGVGILLGKGDGTFQAVQNVTSRPGFSLTTADLNADGKLDLLVGGGEQFISTGSFSVLFGNGDGTFQAPQSLGEGDELMVADMNRDGNLDIIAAKQCVFSPGECASGRVNVFLGHGDGTFQSPQTYRSGGDFASAIAIADLNKDTKPDLLVANLYRNYNMETTGCVGILVNKYFASTTTTLTSSQNPSVSGESVTLTAKVVSSGSDLPTGKVVFENSGAWIGAAPLINGTARLTTSKLPAGRLLLTTVYLGDIYSGKSTSTVLTQVVSLP